MYEDVTKQPYSYLFIGLKADTPEDIRLLTHILGEKDHISVFKIVEGELKCLPTLRKFVKTESLSERRKILRSCRDGCLYYAISEISRNVLNGNIPTSEKDRKVLNRYKAQLREIRKEAISLKKRKSIINQEGGLLPGLLVPAVGFLAQFLVLDT